jgi:hypothetical protein
VLKRFLVVVKFLRHYFQLSSGDGDGEAGERWAFHREGHVGLGEVCPAHIGLVAQLHLLDLRCESLLGNFDVVQPFQDDLRVRSVREAQHGVANQDERCDRTFKLVGDTHGGQAWEASTLWSKTSRRGDLQHSWDLEFSLFAQSPLIDLFFDLHREF